MVILKIESRTKFRLAILLTRELNLRKVVIEHDSKICIDTINRALKEEMPIFVSWEAVSIEKILVKWLKN